jgi:hypothetical protein
MKEKANAFILARKVAATMLIAFMDITSTVALIATGVHLRTLGQAHQLTGFRLFVTGLLVMVWAGIITLTIQYYNQFLKKDK